MRRSPSDVTLERRGGFVPPKPAALAQFFPQLEILDLIGHGGMGAVYKARQRGLDRLVALKILPPETGHDPSFAARFAREARALAKLSHPNIVTVHDSGQAGGLYYLLMEYVDGVNLREAIQTEELTPREALAIVPQVCEALQYAHDEGIVHRDIKPENILLDKKGRVKIADFGLARLLAQTPDDFTLTGSHQVMGTPKYMAPEQLEGSHEVDHRADIYSLGVVFYEMLTGELPLGRFEPPSKKVQVDVRLDEIVLRTLEKEPSRRYQAASQIKSDVETLRGGEVAAQTRHLSTGYEYRSKTEIWGLPLVHVATGIDPRTGKQRVARGIIAVGGMAFGLIAIGGVAVGGLALGGSAFGGMALGGLSVGGIALGGFAAGMFTFGGCSLGLLVALGGLALGFGLAWGGGAIGSIALGGLAIGGYAQGGLALGIHVVSEQNRDPTAVRFFTSLTDSLPFTIPFGLMLALFTSALCGWGIFRRFVLLHDGHSSPVAPDRTSVAVQFEHRRGGGCLVAALLMLLIGACAMLCVGLYLVRSQRTTLRLEAIQRADAWRAKQEAIAAAGEALSPLASQPTWEMADAGPQLTSTGETLFALTAEQIPRVNQVLQSIHQRYRELEAQHTQRQTTEAGHQLTTIEPLSEQERTDLENQLWSQLDAVLNVQQQAEMRAHLHAYPEQGYRTGELTGWAPSILGWAREGAVIEIWKVGQWYHWQSGPRVGNTYAAYGSMPASGVTGGPGQRGPELPTEFRRFWSETATER